MPDPTNAEVNDRIREMEDERDAMHDERVAHIKALNALNSASDQLSKRIGSLRQGLSNASRSQGKKEATV